MVGIGRFLCNKSALYREAFFLFELKRVIAFALIQITKRVVLFWENTCNGTRGYNGLLKVVEQSEGKYGGVYEIWQVISVVKKERF